MINNYGNSFKMLYTLYFTLLILISQVPLIFGFYPEYVIEQYCQRGNEKVFYNVSKLGASGRLIPTTRKPYQPNKNCTVVIVTPPDLSIVLSVRKIDFRQPGLVCLDYIEIFHSNVRFSPTTLCRFKFDLHESVSYYDHGKMQFVYHVESEVSDGDGKEEGFDLTFTVVSEDQRLCMRNNFFLCDNGRCVPYGLTCDSRNNCGDNSDEASSLCDPVPLVWNFDKIMYVLLTSVILLTLSFTCLFIFIKRRIPINNEEEAPIRLSPYHAVHPSGYFYSRNPAGAVTPCVHGMKIESDDEFSNPCYPTGVPPPPYNE